MCRTLKSDASPIFFPQDNISSIAIYLTLIDLVKFTTEISASISIAIFCDSHLYTKSDFLSMGETRFESSGIFSLELSVV